MSSVLALVIKYLFCIKRNNSEGIVNASKIISRADVLLLLNNRKDETGPIHSV